MAEAQANGGVIRTTGVPAYADVEALTTSYSEVQFNLRRQNARMQWLSVVGNISLPPMEILDIEAIVRRMAGGGNYQVDVFEPGTKKPLLFFTLALEGAPLVTPTSPVPGGAPGAYGPQMGPPTVNATMPQMPQGAPPPPPPGYSMQWAMGANGQYVQVMMPATQGAVAEAPRTSLSSDEVALRQVTDLKREIGELKTTVKDLTTKLDTERERAAGKLQTLQDKHDDYVEKSKEREADLKMAAMEARLSKANGDGGGNGMTGFAALATALAPVAQSMMTSSKDQAIAMQQAQTTLITSALRPRDESALMPLVLRSLDLKDPKHQIDAMDAAAQSQMAMFGMMSQIVNMVQQTQPPDSPMMMLLNQALVAAGSMVDKWMNKGEGPGQPPMINAQVMPPRVAAPAGAPAGASATQPQQTQSQAQPQPGPPSATYNPGDDDDDDEDDDDEPAQVVAAPPTNGNGNATANQVAQQIVKDFIATPQIPPAFKTQEWRDLIFRIHMKLDVATVADKFVTLLRTLKRRNAVPPALAGVFTDPEEAITRIIGALPIIAMDVNYAVALRDLVVDTLLADARAALQVPAAAPQN